MTLPQPLTPADCDLRDFPYLPLDARRLLTSETWVLGTGDERSAAMTLWLESWHQVPAGSVPQDDRMLAHLSQAGAKWRKVKPHALRGWIEAIDGRLYHPVVSEKALEAWIEKLSNSLSGSVGNAKRWGVSIETDATKEQFHVAVGMLRAIAPQSKTLKKKLVVTIAMVSPPDEKVSPPESHPDSDRIAREVKRSKEKGYIKTKEEQPRVNADIDDSTSPASAHAASAVGSLCIAMRSAGIDAQPADPRMIALAAQGVTPETLTAACLEAQKSKPGERITPGYVLAILSRWSSQAAALGVSGATLPRAGPGYQTPNEKAKDFADRLTGKRHERNDRHHEIIDINAAPAGIVD